MIWFYGYVKIIIKNRLNKGAEGGGAPSSNKNSLGDLDGEGFKPAKKSKEGVLRFNLKATRCC